MQFTLEACEQLGLTKETLMSEPNLLTIFPEVKDSQIAEYIRRPQGAVIMFDPGASLRDTDDYEAPRKYSSDCRLARAAGNIPIESEHTYLWVRLVWEDCEGETLGAFLFSLVPPSYSSGYARMWYASTFGSGQEVQQQDLREGGDVGPGDKREVGAAGVPQESGDED